MLTSIQRARLSEQRARIQELEQRNRELRAELDASTALHREVKERLEATNRRLSEQLLHAQAQASGLR